MSKREGVNEMLWAIMSEALLSHSLTHLANGEKGNGSVVVRVGRWVVEL
jgi:hypothetical protein